MSDISEASPVRAVPRAEPVGSLLRPARITALMGEIYTGRASASPRFVGPQATPRFGDLARLADRHIAEFVRRQADAGLDVVTDGEIRRSTFISSLYDAAAGFAEADERFEVRDDAGAVIYAGYADPVVGGSIRKSGSPAAVEAAALRVITASAGIPVPFKITLPAPSYFLASLAEVRPGAGYADRQALLDDVVAAERELAAEVVAAGATWLQFDFPIYPGLADPDYAASLEQLYGLPAAKLMDLAIAADSAVAADLPDGVTVAMHICRGNFPGGMWQGSLEPVAERMFDELPFRRYLIEWEDTSREGDYSPLRFAARHPDIVVALGLISTKTPELERDDDVLRRLEEAAVHLPLEQLALCPQCGFASLMLDRLVAAEDAQWRKLDLVGRVAARAWPGA